MDHSGSDFTNLSHLVKAAYDVTIEKIDDIEMGSDFTVTIKVTEFLGEDGELVSKSYVKFHCDGRMDCGYFI